jgi:mannosylglucosylglycerate synthase
MFKMMNIGFISTRFRGTDGVTLETSKWAQIFLRNGYACHWFAGELDRAPAISYLAPEAHFSSDVNLHINAEIVGHTQRSPETTELIHAQRQIIKTHLYRFVQKFKLDMLVTENVLSLPMQIPLGMALTEFVAETQIPTIAHHHDFYWERERYTINAAYDYLQMAFPPRLPNIAHIVINSLAREELARRTGIVSTVAPNVLDFANPPEIDPQAVQAFRHYLGLAPDDVMILQPTRVVQRKGIEHAINLVKALDLPRCKLVVSHEAGDEGFEYATWLHDYAQSQQVDLIFVDCPLADPWGTTSRHYPQFSLEEIYPAADFVTYPSINEGFGNGFLEAVYFKKPLLVNRYATYIRDIEPHGFDVVPINGFVSSAAVAHVSRLIHSKLHRRQVTAHNYAVAKQHFSYETLENRINIAMSELFAQGFNKLGGPAAVVAPTIQPVPGVLAKEFEETLQWAKKYN